MASSLNLLKDLIEIATEEYAMKLIHEKLNGQLELRDIAHTILEISNICPLCNQTMKVGKKACPSCHAYQLRFVNIQNRLQRYKLILNVIPDILSEILEK